MVLVQEAQTKGVREVDMAAVVDNECVAVWLSRPFSRPGPRSRRFLRRAEALLGALPPPPGVNERRPRQGPVSLVIVVVVFNSIVTCSIAITDCSIHY